eukprot:360290-Chlamydomonas_euryale.AAC.4
MSGFMQPEAHFAPTHPHPHTSSVSATSATRPASCSLRCKLRPPALTPPHTPPNTRMPMQQRHTRLERQRQLISAPGCLQHGAHQDRPRLPHLP